MTVVTDWSSLVHIFSSTTSDPVWSGPHWHHSRAASFFDPRPRGLHRRWHVHEDPRHSRRQSTERASLLYVRSGACGDLCHDMPCWPLFVHWLSARWTILQLGSRWYLRPAARPAAVRLECRRPFGFLGEAVKGVRRRGLTGLKPPAPKFKKK